MIDYAHLLMGIVRETFQQIHHQSSHAIRIVTLSATFPNSVDVAEWLHATHFSFDASYRPVPIERLVFGYPNHNQKSPFLFEKYLNYK